MSILIRVVAVVFTGRAEHTVPEVRDIRKLKALRKWGVTKRQRPMECERAAVCRLACNLTLLKGI